MADSPFAGLGLEFMKWQNVPSITETILGGKNPLLKAAGILLAGNGQEGSETATPNMGMGQGVAPPVANAPAGGVGINMNKSSGIGIAPGQFQIPSLSLPKIGTQTNQPGIDVDGDGQIDNFWGIKK